MMNETHFEAFLLQDLMEKFFVLKLPVINKLPNAVDHTNNF